MRKPAALLTALAVAAGITVASPALSPAAALSPGVQFSADDLSTWQTDGIVYALATAANGRVVVGGTFDNLQPPTGGAGTAVSRSALAVLNAETGAPENCTLNVAYSAGTPTVRSLVASPDGNTVYVGGNFTSINGVNVTRVAAINPATCTVTSFRAPAISSVVYAMALSKDRLYLAGAFTTVGGQQRQKFAAVSTTTNSTVLPWVANAIPVGRASTVTADGRAVAVSPDGSKVVVGGKFDSVNGQSSHAIAVVDGTTGANVRNYPAPFIHTNSITKTLYSDGTRFYGGNEGTGGGVFDGRFAINWTTLDQEWRDTCLGATQAVLEHNGTLYGASHAHDCSTVNEFQDGRRNYFTAENASTGILLQWFPRGNDGIGEGIGPRALTIASGRTTGKEYLWAGGEFTQINGAAQQGLTRWGPDDTGNPPGTTPTAEALTNGAIQVRFRTVTDTDDSELTYSVFRNGSTTPIYTTTATSFWWTRPQVTFVDTNVTPGTRYTYRVQVSDGPNTTALSASAAATASSTGSAYAERVIGDGAQIFWRYDETSGEWVQDKSAKATTTTASNGLYKFGAVGGAAGAIPGDASTAATFDGVDDYVWEDQLGAAPTTYSVETWFKTDTTTGGKIIGFGNGRPRTDDLSAVLSSSYDRQVYMENSGRLAFGVYTGATTTVRSALAYNDNQWHHLVATQGSAGMRLYVDGLAVGSNSVTNAQNYMGVWHIGGDNLNSWPNRPSSNYFRGQIDETAIYNAPLTARQVADHYGLGGGTANVNSAPKDAYGASVFADEPDLYWRLDETSGSAADSSYFGQYDGTVGSAASRGVSGQVSGGSAIGTTGSTDSLVVSPQTGSPMAFTTETWIKTSTTTGGKIIGFEAVPTGTGGNYDKQVYMTNSGSLVFGVYSGSARTIQTPLAYNDGQWHHVVAAQDSTGMKLYVDGALQGTNAITTNQVFTGYWRVGGGSTTSWPSAPTTTYFTGAVDEVAVYQRGLSEAEVSEHYGLGSGTTTADDQAPSVPADLAVAVTGSDAALSWSASSDNVAVSEYRVYRGATADFAVDDAARVGTTATPGYTDSSLPVGRYFYRIVAADAAGNAGAATAAVEAVVADTSAPTTPADVTASLSGTSATVTWSASTDNVGVAGYAVHRGASADFAVSDATRIGTVTGTSYADAGLAPGTYYYRVVATDEAGNVGDASAAARVTVNAPSTPPVVVTGGLTADALVAENSAAKTYGTVNYLVSRGGTGAANISYLAFDVPAAPAGKTLTGATLRIRTSTDSAAASADSFALQLVSGSWNESTVNWTTRPTAIGSTVGTLTGANALNTFYDVTLDAAALNALAGTNVTVAMVGGGTDNVRIWSKEAAAASRPALTFTYTS